MSLYSLAAGLFEDLDKARALDHLHHHHPTNEGSDEKHQSGSTTIPRTRRCRGEEDGKRRTMNSGRREADEEQIPTLELLEDCLDNIHKARCCGRPTAAVDHTTAFREIESREDEQQRLTFGLSGTRYSGMGLHILDDGKLAPKSTYVDKNTAQMAELGGAGIEFTVRRCRDEETENGVEGEELEMERGKTVTRGQTNIPEDVATRGWGHPSPSFPASGGCGNNENGTVEGDATAARGVAAFERETKNWHASTGMTASRRARAEFAAHLSDKYLCDILDPLPSSTVVCRIRRDVARQIDLLVTEEGINDEDGWPQCQINGCTPPQLDDDDSESDDVEQHGGDQTWNHDDRHTSVSADGSHGNVGGGGARCLSKGNNPAQRRASREITRSDVVDGNIDGKEAEHDRVMTSGYGTDDGVRYNNKRLSGCSRDVAKRSIEGPGTGELMRQPGNVRRDIRVRTPSNRVVRCEPMLNAGATTLTKREGGRGEGGRGGRGGRGGGRGRGRGREGSAWKNGVRFLLEGSGVDAISTTPFQGADKSSQLGRRVESAEGPVHDETVDVERGQSKSPWICVVCDKFNDEGSVECIVCGRHFDHGRSRSTGDKQARNRGTSGSVVVRRCDSGDKRGVEAAQEDVKNVSGDGGGGKLEVGPMSTDYLHVKGATRRDREKGKLQGGIIREKNGGEGDYDFSRFARMRQTTEPHVKARLGLTGEIKSLLMAIRKK